MFLHGAGKRWSYICVSPVQTILWSQDDCADVPDPLGWVQARNAALDFERPDDSPPFCGGWAGLLSYEFGRAVLPRLEQTPSRDVWPDLAMGLYSLVAVFDHHDRQVEIWHWPEFGACEMDMSQFVAELEQGGGRITPHAEPLAATAPSPNIQQEDYEARIARAIDYVHAGDCFQVNISQLFTFKMSVEGHPYDLTHSLSRQSLAPYSAYFRLDDLALVSNSPERFLSVRNTPAGALEVVTKPIKGTRPRGDTPERDEALAADLLASSKDQAENLMIVDLMRNDLSRVCQVGTVKVPKLAALESFANVHHLVSTVRGELKPGLGAFDLIRATFPGGSVTGAPKIRAMQIIAELEQTPRGPYCGSLLWIAPGWLDGQFHSHSVHDI